MEELAMNSNCLNKHQNNNKKNKKKNKDLFSIQELN